MTSIKLSDLSDYGHAIIKASGANDAETVVKSYRAMAQIYINRENYIQAEAYLNKACQHIAKTGKCKAQLQFINYSFASIYENYGEYEECLKYAEKSIEAGKHERTVIKAEILKALSLYYLKRYNEFEKLYQKLQKNKVSRRQLKGRLEVMHYIRRHDFRSAHSACNSIMSKSMKLEMLILTCEAEGRYEAALEYLKELEEYINSHMQEIRQRDFEEMNSEIGIEMRETENARLKLHQQQLDIDNHNLLRDKSAAEEEAAKLKTANNNLQLQKMALEREKREQSNMLKKQKLTDQDKINNHKRQLRDRGIIGLVIIILGLTVFLIQRYFTSRHLKQHNEELEQARKLVEASDHKKTVFLQNVSHEIRTPLNAILGFLQILTSKDFPLEEEEKAEYARQVQENSTHLTRLINDIFLLSELDSGKLTIKNGVFNCNALCRAAMERTRKKLSAGVELVFKTEVDDDFTIVTDGERLKLVLMHLLSNARKYTSSGEVRLIVTKAGKNNVAFTIEDTGAGIPEEKKELIFERFEKLGSYLPGNGLGLSISKAIGKLLHFDLKLDTAYHGGARFTLKPFMALIFFLFSCFSSLSAQTAQERVYINEHEAIMDLLHNKDTASTNEALRRARVMRQNATKEKYTFGMLSSYRTLACFYLERLNYDEALLVLDEAEAYLKGANAPTGFYSIIYYEKARNYDYLEKAEKCLEYAKKAMDIPFSTKTNTMSQNLYVRALYKLQRYDEFIEEYNRMYNNPNYKKYIKPGRAEIYYQILKGEYDKALAIAAQKDSELSRMETEIEIYKAAKRYKEALDVALKAKNQKTYQRHYVGHAALAQFLANFRAEVLRNDSLSNSNTASQLKVEQARIAKEKQQIETEKENAAVRKSQLLIEKEQLEDQKQLTTQKLLEEQSLTQREENSQLMKSQWIQIIFLIATMLIVMVIIQHTITVRRKLKSQHEFLKAQLDKATESDRLKSAFMENFNINLSDHLKEMNIASSVLVNEPGLPEEQQETLANRVFNAASDMLKVVNDVLTHSQREAMQEFAQSDLYIELENTKKQQ